MNDDCINALYSILEQKNISDECRRAFLCILGSNKPVSILEIPDIFGDKDLPNENLTERGKHVNEVKDCRIKSIEFVNFRCFCSAGGENNKNFGIRFTRNGNPCSLFLVGGNGTGKSSVFSALEWYYSGNSCLADAAHVSEDKKQCYLTYGFGSLETTKVGFKVEIGTNDSVKEEYVDKGNNITTSAFFCSDLDMQQIENYGNNLYNYVLEQLGYGDLVCLRESLDNLSRSINAGIDVSKKELVSTEWDEIIEVFLKKINTGITNGFEKYCKEDEIKNSIDSDASQEEFVSRWNILKGYYRTDADIFLQNNQGEQNFDELVSKLASMYSELCFWLRERQGGNRSDVEVLGEMYNKKRIVSDKERKNAEFPVSTKDRKDILNTMSSLIKEKCDSIIQSTIFDLKEDSRNFIEEVMQRFSPSNEKYKFRYENGGSLSLKIEVTTPTGTFKASPHEYLNTFRFKLFCLAIKIAIAFGKMKERNIMAPIVIDDVLDASDFENTIKLEQFVYTLYKTYDEIVGIPLNFNKPLQLILLTHDDMVQTAFRRGVSLRMLECEKKPLYYNDNVFICGRLFDKDECAENVKDNPARFINLYLNN